MRILALAIAAIGIIFTTTSLHAQTYAPGYPVCLHVYGPATYYDCSFTSLPQCNATASGRAAICELNPYGATIAPPRAYRYFY